MDPVSMDLPTPTIEEPTFNSAQLVNHAPPITQPPTQTPSFQPTHPPYAEMITAAITALKEKDGSSRIAIAKYIDRVYTNLPPNHSDLLTHNLKRLKNCGYLTLVKHSYMLAGSAPPPLTPGTVTVNSNGNGSGGDVEGLTKRKPGRPPKPKGLEAQQQQQVQVQTPEQAQAQYQAQLLAQQQAQLFQQQQQQFIQQQQLQQQQLQQQYVQQVQPQYQPQMQYQPDPLLQQHAQFQQQPQQQAYIVPAEAQSYAGLGAESVFVSLGLADGPVGVQNPAVSVSVTPAAAPGAAVSVPALEGSATKKRPGRPRRDGSTPGAKPVEPKSADQSGSGPKRRPGRPPKAGVNAAAAGSAASGKPRGRPRKSSTPGRKPGRPRRNPAVAANGDENATNVPVAAVPGGPIPTPKRRGRPPRANNQGAASVAGVVGITDVPIAAAFDSENLPNATVSGVTNGAPSQTIGKRRGRPPRSSSAPAVVKKPRRLSGKPLGRPKKNVTSPAVADTKLLVAYEELRGKYAHVLSKIKENVNVLKPCLNSDTPAIALAAVQELEELAMVNSMQQN